MNTSTCTEGRDPESHERLTAQRDQRLADLLAAVRMSWDEVFDLPSPRQLSQAG